MISAVNLSYAVGKNFILDGVNLTVEKGESLAIMGMSGAGKSTLLKCMGGLLRPTSGSVIVDGIDLAQTSEGDLNLVRIKIGMVFQYAALFDSMTVYENVAFGLRRHRHLTEKEIARVVREKLAMVGLPHTENMMPSELSGGMQKRVGLARALALDPEIVLYDEPTAGLDPITSAVIAELIVKTRDQLGVTSVVVSHDLATIRRVAKRIAMLHDGKIVAMGSTKEIESTLNPIVRQFLTGSAFGPIQITR